MMGKELNIWIRDEILKLQRRLMEQLRIPPKDFDMNKLVDAFKNHDLNQMQELSIQLNNLYSEQNKNMTWPSMVFHLLRMESGSLNKVYSVPALGTGFQADRIRRADVAEHFEAVDAESTDSVADFVCPITYEEESDVVLLIKRFEKPLLSGIDGKVVNEILSCPLAALRCTEFVKSVVNYLDHPICLSAMKDDKNSNRPIQVSPLTRAPVLGGLCLGAAEDHSTATDWTIAQLMTGGKRVGNSDQWFALFWYLIIKGQVPYLTPIVPKLTQHMIFRLNNHFGTASLTAIPYACQTSLPVGICCWFSLNVEPKRFLQAHCGEVPIFLKLAELSGYPIEDQVVRNSFIISTEERLKRLDSEEFELLKKSVYRTSSFSPNVLIDGEVPEDERSEILKKLPLPFSDIPVQMVRIAINHFIGGNQKDDIPFVNWFDSNYSSSFLVGPS